MKDFLKRVHSLGRKIEHVPVKNNGVTKSDDDDPFTVLRHKVPAINDFVENLITQIVAQGAMNHVEGSPFVMRLQVFYVLQHEGAGTLFGDDSCNVKEQGALGFVGKSVRPAKGIFLGHARDGKRLARESAQQYVVVGNVVFVNLGNVTVQRMAALKVLGIGFLSVGIPFAGKDTFAADGLESQPDTANSGKQVDEGEVAAALRWRAEVEQTLQLLGDMRGGRHFAFFPPANLPDIKFEMVGNLQLCVCFARNFQIVKGG